MPPRFLTTIADPRQLDRILDGTRFMGLDYPRLAVVGRSNVGKSTLLNRLSGAKIARVSATPGKTRAIQVFAWDEKKIILVDFPGYGFARVSDQEQNHWRTLIQTYLKNDRGLDHLWVLVDAKVGPTVHDLDALHFFTQNFAHVDAVITKTDQLKTQSDRGRRKKEIETALSQFPNLKILAWTQDKKPDSFEPLQDLL